MAVVVDGLVVQNPALGPNLKIIPAVPELPVTYVRSLSELTESNLAETAAAGLL